MSVRVTREEIARGLRKLGMAPGDVAMVHSSLKSFGYVEGGADAVIDAFLDVLGPGGTLAMPTMGMERGGAFDPVRTPASTGLIPEMFRRRPGVVRSAHPTHSVAATGRKAKWLIHRHEEMTAVNRLGPYGKLVDLNAAYLSVGTGVHPYTIFHAFEEWMGLPYLDYEGFAVRSRNERTGELELRRGRLGLAGHRGFYVKDRPPKVEVALREAGLVAEINVGNSTLLMFRARPAAELILNRLKAETDLLLCDGEKCDYCAQARACMEGWTPSADPAEILRPITLGDLQKG